MEALEAKECFKCGENKTLSHFYKHAKMLDGHVNKCKECNKKDVRNNRKENVDYYRAYDIARGRPNTTERSRKYRDLNPIKYNAHSEVNNALRAGRLEKGPCEVCANNSKVVAHHDNYAEPLVVRWLCQVHHSEWHAVNGEGLNG